MLSGLLKFADVPISYFPRSNQGSVATMAGPQAWVDTSTTWSAMGAAPAMPIDPGVPWFFRV
jgi:hypothetical protein